MKFKETSELMSVIPPLMAGFPAPWSIAGGWAIDLFLGRQTRQHKDVELAIFRQDQSFLRQHLHSWTFEKIVNGRREPWEPGEILHLPVHEIHANSTDDPRLKLEFLLNDRDDDNWVFRRDPRITLPLSEAILLSPSGLPVLAPEIVLLYKAKSPRENDNEDFRSILPALTQDQRIWLKRSLQLGYSTHLWLVAINSGVICS